MVCIFCGKENDDGEKKCKFCGFEFEDSMVSSTDMQSSGNQTDNVENSEYLQSDEISEETEIDTEETIDEEKAERKSKYKWKVIPEVDRDDSSAEDHDRKEIITAAVFYIIVASITVIAISTHGSIGGLFELEFQIALGVVGLIAYIVCGGFEGEFPGTFKGTVIRTTFLILAWDVPNIITIPLYVIVIGFSLYYLYDIYRGRWQGILLGAVSTLCLPFLGVFVAILGALLLGGLNSKKKKR